ncbi:MAG: hypothetical protein AAGA77_18775 [Bacteroidota bacterium]
MNGIKVFSQKNGLPTAKINVNEVCNNILNTTEQADKMFAMNEYFDDSTIDYLPRIRYEMYSGQSGSCIHDFGTFLIRKLVNISFKNEITDNPLKLADIKISRLTSIFLSSTGLSPLLERGFWMEIKISDTGEVEEVKIIQSKLNAENLKKLKELSKVIKQTLWLPGLFKKQEVNSILNYLVYI